MNGWWVGVGVVAGLATIGFFGSILILWAGFSGTGKKSSTLIIFFTLHSCWIVILAVELVFEFMFVGICALLVLSVKESLTFKN